MSSGRPNRNAPNSSCGGSSTLSDRGALGRRLFGHGPGDDVVELPGDGDGLVGEPLEVPGEQCDVDANLDRVGRLGVADLLDDLMLELIDTVVGLEHCRPV